MKRPTRTLLFASMLLIAALVIGAALGTAPRQAQAQSSGQGRSITVTGIGSVSITPDTGYIRVGVDIADPSLSAALNAARTNMENVMAALAGAGVAESDIATDQYTIFREDRFDPSGSGPTQAFRVINIVRVTVRDVAQLADVLNSAVNAGANAINSVEFGAADVRPAESDARALALADARMRAEELAASVGGSLGQVITIQETAGFIPYDTLGRGMGGGGAGPITPGALQVSISLIVTFELQ